ncbi:YodC family protein [Variovorax saccharolyticus]|uniref:YodC family protein n=1 Tax=Variovorax saccharolyticus TaxID=3053516 RepID=UPI002576275E|nr:DUF2158 domain-containing protein [Variovorax sp. J22R187]MDM0018371.1 DUF2158 domain-containing protein [Variovorax sp. J22R187]
MAFKFEVGDVVKLASDGPEMTIKAQPSEAGRRYYAQWFAGKKLEQGEFYEDQLVLVKNKP